MHLAYSWFMLDVVGKHKVRLSHNAARIYQNQVSVEHSQYQWFSDKMSRVMRKPTFWLLTWSGTNQAVWSQKMARGLKFRV